MIQNPAKPKPHHSHRSKPRGTFSSANNFKLFIAILLIGVSLFLALWRNLPVTEFLVVVTFAFALAILSFLIVGKISGQANIFNINFKSVSGGFAVFILVIVTYFQISNRNLKFTDIFEVKNPSELSVWEKPDGNFKFFNAPFAYAGTTHFLTKLKWFESPNFSLSVLMFDVKDSAEHYRDFVPRLKNLRIFLDSLKLHHADISKIEVRVYTGGNVPNTSFFITNKSKDKKPYSIMYMSKDMKPEKSIISESNDFYDMLNGEYKNFWDDQLTEKLSINKLLDKRIALNSPVKEFIKDASD
jgi:hypothetical protein